MNEEEDQERLLFNSLGVTSANVEDVERIIISEANSDSKHDSASNDNSDMRKEDDELSRNETKLLSKLRAIELEIEAVSSSIKPEASTSEEETEEGKTGNNLQKALATDRLKSLERAKAQIQREISGFSAGPSWREDTLLKKLVEERPKKRKKVLKDDGESSGARPKRHLKTVSYDDDEDFDAVLDAASSGFMETEREELVRKGLLTPFHSLKGFEKGLRSTQPQSSNSNFGNRESEIISRVRKSLAEIQQARPTTKLMDLASLPSLEPPTTPFQRLRRPLEIPASDGEEKKNNKRRCNDAKKKRPLPGKKWRKKPQYVTDDENEENEESEVDASSASDISLEGGLKIPFNIYNQLFEYQRIGVQWLWELHCQHVGGIIGDEMGLGKTVQVISFLASLHYSSLYKPSIVVCPATLLEQWEREAKTWYPKFKVAILHDSALRSNTKTSSESGSEDLDDEEDKKLHTKARKSDKWVKVIDRVLNSDSGLLLTTYEQVRINRDKLSGIRWGYMVLDEGHRIRNPNADITLICKEFKTKRRIIMTGAPIQNKLSELWSLFDFVFPGKLGVLPVFEAEFSVPITIGGYANATPLQVSTAYRCAVALRDIIMPYLLRRMKADVNAQLPKKTEHVLFCSLTPVQLSAYRAFLASSDVEQIFEGSRNSLYGIDIMRKICNHPDLLEREFSQGDPDYGNPMRSGKMQVVDQVMKVWKEQGHRVLIFTQTQQMLDILEKYVNSKEYVYRRMDGYTPVKQRMALMDEFNNSNEVFVFLLTTKVGGLGTNLTGADRVIIYDPDWNPSTDMQARERAWRIGQKRDVTVYRLITRGTIEEKVYQRQIYKNFLTHKVLKNPLQKRFFKAKDMKDLFTLQHDAGNTETSNIFAQLSEDVNVRVESGTDAWKDEKGKEKVLEEESEKADEGNDILKSLMDAHGIHSAMNHDAILNVSEDQKLRMEEEASRIAHRAAEALRNSSMLRSHESFAVPTWTGHAGSAGAPAPSGRRFGSTGTHHVVTTRTTTSASFSIGSGIGPANGRVLSSAELLNRIHGTHASAASDAIERDLEGRRGGSGSRNVVIQPEVLIRLICSFLQERGGSADSVSITEYFKNRVRSEDLVMFKSLLKEIAALEKGANGSKWVLKPEYTSNS
ncbi:Protein CHROMATIN REMODELING 8 [Rhynchospora pubera]|uniref:Protein CHROMATIN REMODELING 8 n=1 Tax=Rhynchospora pubera TaxID=906938 RepID=A0AAV8H391_9POAL|nr:Protein CHROMATIN REMODELING 8 [Rhynchospora pubera]